MKFIFLVFVITTQLFSSVVKSPLLSINNNETIATIKIEKIDVGMSGFIYHKVSDNHGSILKNVVVTSFDEKSKIAKLKVTDYDALVNNALPSGKWRVQKGDDVILAFGYTRGLLIAPNEDIYYKISRNTNIQWVHPDVFATILSFNAHPTPLLEDFIEMSNTTSVGLVFMYLEDRVYTLDSKSFKILNISEVKLKQGKKQLPFYTRVPEIASSWWKWGAGTSELEYYEPYYYSLLIKANPKNKTLLEIIKNRPEDLQMHSGYIDSMIYDAFGDINLREYFEMPEGSLLEYFDPKGK